MLANKFPHTHTHRNNQTDFGLSLRRSSAQVEHSSVPSPLLHINQALCVCVCVLEYGLFVLVPCLLTACSRQRSFARAQGYFLQWSLPNVYLECVVRCVMIAADRVVNTQ